MRGSGNTIGWTVHIGSDFPETILKEIQSWGTRCNLINTPKRLTTRGLNIYKQNERRGTARIRQSLTTISREAISNADILV